VLSPENCGTGGNGKIRTCVGSNFTRHRSAALLLPYSYVSLKPLSHVPVKLLLRNSRATSGKPAHGLLRFVILRDLIQSSVR
jgi:hypothetical protein